MPNQFDFSTHYAEVEKKVNGNAIDQTHILSALNIARVGITDALKSGSSELHLEGDTRAYTLPCKDGRRGILVIRTARKETGGYGIKLAYVREKADQTSDASKNLTINVASFEMTEKDAGNAAIVIGRAPKNFVESDKRENDRRRLLGIGKKARKAYFFTVEENPPLSRAHLVLRPIADGGFRLDNIGRDPRDSSVVGIHPVSARQFGDILFPIIDKYATSQSPPQEIYPLA